MITKILKKKMENETDKKIDLDKNFVQNNLDSLDIITIISLIEDEFKIHISEQKIKKIKNFSDLSRLIKNS